MNFLEIAKQAIAVREAVIGVNDKNDQNDKTPQPLEAVLKGQAVELWSDSEGRLFMVADQEDVELTMRRLGASRGEVYTAAEVRCLIQSGDPATVAEVHRWKKEFNAIIRREYKPETGTGSGEPEPKQ